MVLVATKGCREQVLVYGKGGKTRAIKLPASLWQELQWLRGDAAIGEPVFTSRKKKGHLKEMQVNRIVKAAAKRVPGLEEAIAQKAGCIAIYQDIADLLAHYNESPLK